MSSKNEKHIDLMELENMYSKLLNDSHYAGEIVLSETQLIEISDAISSYSGYIISDRLNNLLLVLAVNIAYFYYDDEGFWKHFYELCKFKINIPSTEIIGQKIEKSLLEKGLMKYKREGPFKYVGAILEQTGITNRNIPVYARLIQEIVGTYGIRNIRNITYERYRHLVEYSNSSKYLKTYLLDEAGWDFTLYMTKVLYYLGSSTIDTRDLYKFKGVHPKFWEEFFKYYLINNSQYGDEKVLSMLKPVILYDESKNGIYIKLPSKEYNMEQTELASNKRNNLYIHLDSFEKFKYKYSGILLGKDGQVHKWEIDGWDLEKEKYACFHKKYGYIKDVKNLRAGNYYIITNDKRNIPMGKIIKSLGTINFSNASVYYAFEINIEEAIDKYVEVAKVELNWRNTNNQLHVNSYFDIFTGDLPEISISDIGMLEKDKVLVFYDIGEGIKRVKDYRHFSELRNEVKNKKVVKGHIWTENMHRSRKDRDSTNEESLKFCVLPSCQLLLPNGFYSINDKIKFKSSSPYIKYEDCKKKEDNLWVVNEGIEVLEGRIQVGGDKVYFNHAINRGYMVINQNNDFKYFDFESLIDSDIIKMYGKPKATIDIQIDDGEQVHTLIKNIYLDERGEHELEYSIIKNALIKLNLDSGKFYFGIDGSHIDADMGYFNFGSILNRSYDKDKLRNSIRFLRKINEDVAEKIYQIFEIYRTNQSNLKYLEPHKQTSSLDKLYKILFIMSQEFDESDIYDGSGFKIKFPVSDIENQEILITLCWYKKALETVDKGLITNISSLKEDYNNLSWHPEIQRWKNKIDELYVELQSLCDTKKMYLEWTDEVRKQKKFHLKSNISCRNGGKQLTSAWIDYLKGNYLNSIDKLGCIELTDDNIINDLKILLQATIYIKLTRMNALEKLINSSTVHFDEVKVILNAYNNVCLIISGSEIETQEDIERKASIFPFRQEDMEFLIKSNELMRNGISGENLEEIKISRNWIINLIAYKHLENNKELNQIFLRNFESLMDTIPESPEKEELIKKIIH